MQTNGTEQFSTKKILNMTSRGQGISSELSDNTIKIKEKIHNGSHTEYITDQKNSNNKDREKKYRDGDKINGPQAHSLDSTNERRFADNRTMFTQHIEKQRNVHTLNQNDINNSVNSVNVPENELTYQFQRWGQNHTVRILESSEGIRLKPSDALVSDRLHEAQNNDVTAQRWVLTEQDERQGQRHQPHEEQENEGKFENDHKDES
ncbi:effector protein [Escherichia coli]|nr:effector protein [Escherichia coli O1]EFN9796630.1 effector protein [Escherichia coli]EFO2512528.1 effector protein [Escherichia coli]EFO2543653.1 effector protein [Escherichia coli]EFO2569684.1 effector protein [Escherichia coli]